MHARLAAVARKESAAAFHPKLCAWLNVSEQCFIQCGILATCIALYSAAHVPCLILPLHLPVFGPHNLIALDVPQHLPCRST